MSRKQAATPGHDPYVKHVQVRPCDVSRTGATRVNIAGYEFELIEPAGQAPHHPAQPKTIQPERPTVHEDSYRNEGDGARGNGYDGDQSRDEGHAGGDGHNGGNGHAGGNGHSRGNGQALTALALARDVRHPDSAVPAFQEARYDEDGEAASSGGGFDLSGIHRIMRGKYIAAVLLGSIFAAAGVWAGLKFAHPIYQSTGLVNVISHTVIYETPEKRNTSFLEMVHALAANFTSQQMIASAMETDPWRVRPKPRTNETLGEFTKNLTVLQEGQLLVVKYTDPEPLEARAGVDAIIHAFESKFFNDQKEHRKQALDALEDHARQLTQELIDDQGKIAKLANEFGPNGLKAQRDYLAVELRRIDNMIADIDVQGPLADVSDALGLNDRYLQQLEDKRFDLKSRLAQLDASGAGAQSRQHVEVVTMLKSVESQIDERKKEIAKESTPAPTAGAAKTPALSPVEAKKDRLRKRREDIDKEMKTASEKILQIDELLINIARVQHDLDTTQEALRQRQLEQQVYELGITYGDLPQTPYRNTHVAASVGGGLGGMALGFALMALIGLADRRVLDPGDTMNKGQRYPVLGILPELPEDLADPEQNAVAAHGVHEIRNRLQLAGAGAPMRQVFTVTGSAAGSGKTSLTIALGVSFAAGGFKTLVVDCDLVGGGLSSRITSMARRRIGQLLLREGLVTAEQLDDALLRGRASGRKVGEMLVALGYIAEADMLAALERQVRFPIGILDAMEGEELAQCAVATGIDNLWAVTLGSATAADTGMISGAAMQRFVDRARQQFEVVIIDSGPVPGSIEASIAAAHSDSVILVVARGDTRPYVERSIAYLRELPVRFAGIVFNRAKRNEVERYGSSRVSSSGSLGAAKVEPVELPENLRFGPIPRSVASRSVRQGQQFRSN